jgi:hypothetical protein
MIKSFDRDPKVSLQQITCTACSGSDASLIPWRIVKHGTAQ